MIDLLIIIIGIIPASISVFFYEIFHQCSLKWMCMLCSKTEFAQCQKYLPTILSGLARIPTTRRGSFRSLSEMNYQQRVLGK